jgi:hypothetical protein
MTNQVEYVSSPCFTKKNLKVQENLYNIFLETRHRVEVHSRRIFFLMIIRREEKALKERRIRNGEEKKRHSLHR